MYATNVLKFAHYSCILLNYIQTCLVYRDRLKKNVLTLCLITQEIKKKTKKITLQIIGTIIKLKITGTYRFKISRDKYFPLKKKYRKSMNTDSSNSHSHDINNRSNNDPSHPNKSSNFEYRNKHENPPNIPPSPCPLVVQAWQRATWMTETVPKEKYGSSTPSL